MDTDDVQHKNQQLTEDAELKLSELRYRRLFETAQDGILILDGDTGKTIDANTFILDMLGYPLDYFVGKHLWELGFLKDKSLAEDAFLKLKTDGYIRYEDLPLETREGKIRHVEFISNGYLVGDKRIIQCNIRDITKRKRTEDALALASRKLNLLSSITRHDIKNQLLALMAYLELSKDSLSDPSAMSVYIEKVERVAETIDRQIEFTKIYQDMGVSVPVWQNVADIVRQAMTALRVKNVQVDIDRTDLDVYADPLFSKVFYNLIDNTLNYGGDNLTRITLSSHESGDGRLLIFEDDGMGISLEDKTHLFGKGFGKHTGLGLFLSREILSITGIIITETGEPGKGARFEMLIPNGASRFSEEPVYL
ncbi:PAS domain S-box protein [uncultured Methanoregula sp.]|uniref:PAS domain S-box protein n=1 Tax=uncultured Methanoregula sp. TaxID=1005933 RepID=UPI002AAB02E1|nr:PAS domain S-box protein [uncultured Methanoregula sp.]